MELREAVKRFQISHQPPFASPDTGAYYHYILGGLLWYAARERWQCELEKITLDQISSFLFYISDEGCRWGGNSPSSRRRVSPATLHHYTRVVKTFFTWASDEGLIEVSPMARMRLPQPHYRQVPPYTGEEVSRMLAACEQGFRALDHFCGSRDHALISIFADTGIRRREMVGLTTADIDPKLNRLRIRGKGGKWRVVPLADEARRSLKRYLKWRGQNSYEELWLTDEREPLSAGGVQEMILRVKKRAGISGGGRSHRFRHFFATSMLDGGASIRQVQALLGHEGPEMTLRYAHELEVEEAIACHRRLSPLDRLKRRGGVYWGDGGRQA